MPGPSENMKIYRNLAAPGYFDVMRIPLVEGRDFTGHDDDKSLPVMIVNQEFLRRFLPNQNPIGRKVNGWARWFTIVGVVKDSKYHTLTENPQPYFYIPIRQIFRPEMGVTFHVRSAGAPESAVGVIRQAAQTIDPNVAMFDAMPMTQSMGASLFGQKVAASLLSVLGGIALLLAAVGLYGVMAYSITQRTQEIGIRMALGAMPRDVLRMILGQGMRLMALGVGIGLLGGFILTRFLASMLYGVRPLDPLAFLAGAVALVTAASFAAYLPARRATKVDPMVALRYE